MLLSVGDGVLDTLRVMPYVPDLSAVLTAGYRVESDGVTYRVEPYELGPVVLPSGKVVGCDPLVAHVTPFVDSVAPGRYPLRAWVAMLHADGGEGQRRITALQLTVVDEPIAAWSMALLPGQDVTSLGDEDFSGTRSTRAQGRWPTKSPSRHCASGTTRGSTRSSSRRRSRTIRSPPSSPR